MTKFLPIAAFLAALTSPVCASAADPGQPQRFTRDNETYIYTTESRHDRLFVDGHSYPSGAAFHLVIRGNQVSGTSAGVPVDFLASTSHGASETLASR